MHKIQFVFMVILALITVACSQSKKSLGDWQGKTNQGYDISIKVEMVNGYPTVTKLKYGVKMSASSYSCTRTSEQPTTISAKIENRQFSYTGSDFQLSGTFEGDNLNGTLRATNVHPQGYGTAVGNVTFTLNKDEKDLSNNKSTIIKENIKPIQGEWKGADIVFNISDDGKKITSVGGNLDEGCSLIPTTYGTGFHTRTYIREDIKINSDGTFSYSSNGVTIEGKFSSDKLASGTANAYSSQNGNSSCEWEAHPSNMKTISDDSISIQ